MPIPETIECVRRQTLYQDPGYWDCEALMKASHEIIGSRVRTMHRGLDMVVNIEWETFDGFLMTASLMDLRPMSMWWNGYITFPLSVDGGTFHNLSDYDALNQILPLPVELTYGSNSARKIGWDHNHYHDQQLNTPMDPDYARTVTGPVQILEEALAVVRTIRMHHHAPNCAKTLRVVEEELMAKSWAPARIAGWLALGHDVFDTVCG